MKTPKNAIETVCQNCGTVLTDKHGKRMASAHFDSSLPSRGITHPYVAKRRQGSAKR